MRDIQIRLFRQITGIIAILFAQSLCSCSSGPASVIDGNWLIPCAAVVSLPGTQSVKTTLNLSGGAYTLLNLYYSDSGCSALAATLTETGTFTVGGADALLTSATDVNFVQTNSTALPATQNEATYLNTGGTASGSICTGITFTSGTSSSVAGAACSFSSLSFTVTPNASTIQNLFFLSTASSPSILTIGGSGTAELLGTVSPAARPSSLTSPAPTTFTKQ